jgi:Bacteriophage tail sheath protein
VYSFLNNLWMQGALVGATPEQAFFILCDETNNPASSVDEGKLVVDVGIAPVKPAEFVIFRISQWQGGASTAE